MPRPLRYSINVTLDGCIDHRAITPDEEMHMHATNIIARADALILGRVTYQLMEAGWRHPVPAGARPAWMEPFAQVIGAKPKYVVSRTLTHVDWNSEVLQGDLRAAVEALKAEPGEGLYVGGVMLPMALAEMGLIDEFELILHPRIAGYGPTLFAGLSRPIDLRPVDRVELASGAVATRYVPR